MFFKYCSILSGFELISSGWFACNVRPGGVEGIGILLRFGDPGRPVTANGVSINGENALETREKHRG